MNFKKLLLGSVFAASAFGLVACGEDSSSSSPEPGNQQPASSGDPYVPPEDTKFDVISMSEIGVAESGESVFITGSFNLVRTDTSASQNIDNIAFSNIEFNVINDVKNTVSGVKVNIGNPTVFPTQGILAFNQMLPSVNYADPAFGSECGAFHIDIIATATDGEKEFKKSARAQFTRPDVYCQILEPSSSSIVQTGVIMTTCDVKMNSATLFGLDLATCTASANPAADIVLKKSGDGDIHVTSGNGSLFNPIINDQDGNYKDDYERDYYPEDVKGGEPTYNTDFRFRDITSPSINNIIANDNKIYVVKTPAYNEATAAGFYAIVLLSSMEANNKDFDMTFRVWKAQ